MATKFLVCLVLIAGASAVPLSTRDDFDNDEPMNRCAQQCKDGPTKFKYEPSKTYVYEYKAETETLMAGASEEKARMQIETHANIEVISQCEFALRLQNVKIFHSTPFSETLKPAEQTQEFQRELTANTLRFSFDDGIIRDICHPTQEKPWVLNFKRGLLSAFQNSMDDLTKSQKVNEIDISGECEVQYNKTKEWPWDSTIKVTKSKNLVACSKHDGWRTVIRMVPYQVPSNIQSLPIMKSSHQCEYVISSSGVLQSASCHESHVFAPFSNHQSGGATKVHQTLTFRAMKSRIETSQDRIESRSNLLFYHLNGINEVENNKEAAEQKLKEICEQTKSDIRPETPRLFSELVQIVKVLDSNELKKLYKKIKSKRLCSQNEKALKFLLDTLPIAGTPGAVDFMANIINNDDYVNDMEKQVWLASLSLIPEPSQDMMPSLLKLLNGKLSDQALLPVSALLHTLCEKKFNCDRSFQFRKIVKKINKNINSCNSKYRTKVMTTLRAIGNIGYGKDFLVSLKSCLRSRNAPLEYKVAAAEAYRRFPCQQNEEIGPLFQVFEDGNADPELRIISFLSLMRCPRDSVLEKIAAQLKKEDDVNVGTFVYTHLENVKKTSDPHGQEIAQAVKRLDLRKFDGGLKTSRCVGHSALLNRLNLGYVADADLIWSQSSVLPRAAKVNLTLALFGQSVNVFEGGIRVDGLEHFVQKYFGKEGYFPDEKTSHDDFEAFIYARVFGNELLFQHMKGSKDLEKLKLQLPVAHIIEKFSKTIDYRYKYSHSQQLIDQSLIIPTAIGMPLNLTLNSSVSVDTEVKGKIDLRGIFSRSKLISILTDGGASAALEVTGSMMVDAHIYKQGLRMRNTLHSSVNFKSTMTIKDRQILDFEINSPQERQELFDARSQFFIIHDSFENEQDMIKENRQELNYCTGDKFSKVTGLELCADVRYPNASMKADVPYFPLSGPARVSLVLNKKDTQRSYKIFAKWIRNSKKLEAQLQLDTPGSKIDRHISADVTIGIHKIKHVDVVLISPWKKVLVNGKAAQNSDMASLTGSVIIDDVKKYKLISEVKISKDGDRHQYLPFVEIENLEDRTTLLSGSVIYNEKKDIFADLQMNDLNKKAYVHSSQLSFNKQEMRLVFLVGEKQKLPYQLRIGTSIKQSGKKKQNLKLDPELLIQTPKRVIASLKSNMEFNPKPMRVKGNVELTAIRMRMPFIFKVDVRQRKNIYPVLVKLSSTMLTGDINGKVDLRKNSLSSHMKINYKTSSKRDLIIWTAKMTDRSKNTLIQYKVNSVMTFKRMPDYNTESSFELTHKKKTSALLTIKYGKKSDQKKIEVATSASVNLKNAQIKADLKAKIPEKNVDIKMELDHSHNKKKVGSEIKVHLAPWIKDDINAAVNIQNKGNSLYLVTGSGTLDINGKQYNLKSELEQKAKHRIQHTISVSSSDDTKHKLVSHYKNANDIHEFVTNIESTQLDAPLKLSMSGNLKSPSDFSVDAALKENKIDLYSLNVLSKFEKLAGKWIMRFNHPLRKIKAYAKFNKVNDKVKTEALINWNVDSKDKIPSQIQATSYFTLVSKPNDLLLKTNIKVNTPFKKWRVLTSMVNFEKSDLQLKSSGRFAWGGIHKQISSKLSAKLPISFENTKLSFEAKTPFDNYRDIEIEVDHEYASDSELKTMLKGKMDDYVLNLSGTKNKKEKPLIQGDLTLKTPHPQARQLVASATVAKSDEDLKVLVKVDKDGKKYSADLNCNVDEQTHKLTLNQPGYKTDVLYVFQTKKKRKAIEFTVNSWKNRKQKISVSVKGDYHDVDDLALNVDVKSPFKSFRKVGLEIDHRVEEKELRSKIIVLKNRAKTGYDIKLSDKNGEMSTNILLLLSPAYEKDVSMVTKVQYKLYPVTVSSQMSWDHSSIIDLTGSYKAKDKDDLQINLKLTTPFEDLENINVIASHVLKKSMRVSHLNIDYDVKKVIDIEVQYQNDELMKIARVKIDSPVTVFQVLDTGVKIDLNRGVNFGVDFELGTQPEEKYEGVVNLNVGKNDVIKGIATIRTPIEGYKQINGKFTKYNPNDERKSTLTLSKDKEDLVDVAVDNKWEKNKFNIEITTKGKVLEMLISKYDEFVITQSQIIDFDIIGIHIIPKQLQKDAKGNLLKQIVTEFNMEQENEEARVGGSISFDYGQSQNRGGFNIRKAGEKMNNIDLEILLTDNELTMSGKFKVKLVDDIKLQALLNDTDGELSGLEFSFSEKSGTLETEGKVHLGEIANFQSSFHLFMSDIKHIELTTTTKTNIRGYELTSVKYTHEGQDNRVSCSLTVDDIKGNVGSIDLIAESSPIHLFSLTVKTPYKDYKEMVISGNYDETTVNGLVKVKEDKISISGVHDNFKNGKLTLKTPFQLLQELSVSVDGDLSDGSSRFTLRLKDDNQINGTMAIKYKDLSEITLKTALMAQIDKSKKKIMLEMMSSDKPRKSHFFVALNDKDQVELDTHWESDETKDAKLRLNLELRYPSLDIQTKGLILNLDGDTKKADGKIQILSDSGKVLDADINLDKESETKASIFVHEPKMMEYRFTQNNFHESKENSLYFNWNRMDPEANLIVKSVIKDDSNSYKTDKTISLTLTCPKRSVGVEHSIVATRVKVESQGKVFWNDGRESQVSYNLELNDLSNRRKNLYDGELKIQLPTRTIGLYGSTRDKMNEQQVESTISWDMDKDSSKKIGIKANILKGDHMQADISLILPQDAHIDSKLILNKGNTILEGQTKIFYSEDSSKTLTLFSKVENRPESSFFYSGEKSNYSIQVGVSHPESRIDVKLNSHWGIDKERLTTSLGLDYLTSGRQNKNMDLFVEINKLKREINLISSNPYNNFGFTSAILSKDPFQLRLATTVDDQDTWSRHLLIDPKNKKLVFDMTKFGRGLSLSAHYPNKTALQLDMKRLDDGEIQQYTQTVFRLHDLDTLQATLHWKPGMLAEIRDMLFKNLKQGITEYKKLVDNVMSDMQTEVYQKYEDVTLSINEDVKPLAEFLEQEIVSFENDLDQLQRNLRSNFDFCDVKIGDFDLGEEFAKLQRKMKKFVKNVDTVIQPYKTVFKKALQTLSELLEEMKNFPPEEIFTKIARLEYDIFKTHFLDFSMEVSKIKADDFNKFWILFEEYIEKIFDPQPLIKDLNEQMSAFVNKQLSSHMVNMIKSNEQLASKIKTAVKNLKEKIMNHPFTDEIIDVLENSGGEVYQQVKWAYNYWAVEDNLPKYFDWLINLINEVIDEEVKEQMGSMYRFIRNPVTKFDPEQGVLVAEIPLPVSLDRIDQIPDVEHISNQLVKMLENQLGSPNQTFLTNLILAEPENDSKKPSNYEVISNK